MMQTQNRSSNIRANNFASGAEGGASEMVNPKDSKSNKSAKSKPKLTPSQLIKRQLSGNIVEGIDHKPKIIQFFNIGDYSIHTESEVPIDEPLFESIPGIIQFTDYEPLQIKTKVFKLRNKDKVARRIRIIQPESRLFQVYPYGSEEGLRKNPDKIFSSGSKVAPGLEVTFVIKFSPEAKIDYRYDLEITTEREKFVVPVIAVGKRAMIDFPDMINFGRDCPVKYITEKPVIIRNLGDKTTKWEIKLPKGFQADKSEGVLEFGRSEQIILKFYPLEKKLYEATAKLIYDGLEAYIPITGNAKNGNVYLSKDLIKLGDAYISLETQQTLEIINKSNVKIDFEWRAYSNEKDENIKKKMLMDQLDTDEKQNRMMLKTTANLENNQDLLEIQDDDDSDYEEVDEKTLMLKKQRKLELLLQRKYENIKKAIEEDLLLFQDEIFDISPLMGTIWPNSEMTITVSFRPKAALKYSCKAYCNISCSDSRLALTLNGEGLGPKALLSTNNIPVGDIFVNEPMSCPLAIENKGEIPARFKLIKNNTPFSNMIKFDIEEDVLDVGTRMSFYMHFKSSKVGEFQEIFRWALEGSREELTLLVRGHVRAPSFEFGAPQIDFGTVSYQFDRTETIKLENTSVVPFKFHLRIPLDSKNNEKEFEIKPESYEIGPGDTKEISIKFTPRHKKEYFMVMVLDIEGVGKDMKSIPLIAKSDVPVVKLSTREIQFGNVFLRDPKTEVVTLMNESGLPARFKVMPQSQDTQTIARIFTDRDEGMIDPLTNLPLGITLTTSNIADINLDLFIKIMAPNEILHLVKIFAKSIGPQVIVKETLIDFGECPVLEDFYREITIINKSSIKADFYAFTKNKDSIFKPIQRHHHLKENSTIKIQVICNADDTSNFSDVLHLVIKEGVDKEVKLKAKGIGSTIFCKEDLKIIDFGTRYTFRDQTKEIFIENKGRRMQKLQWVRKKEEVPEEDEETKKKNKDKKKQPKKDEEGGDDDIPTFSIFPEERDLPKKTGIMFQFRAVSTKRGKISETFVLLSTIDGERKPIELRRTVVTGTFISPKLIFQKDEKPFKYKWEKGIPVKTISKQIKISCNSVLPTNFRLEIEKPFSVYPDSFSLLPDKSAMARIDFDPTFNHSKRSGVERRKLIVRHLKHPQKESIDIVGEFAFPNLELETHEINFGSVLNDTSKKIYMKMTNVSEMNVEYEWSFLDENKIAQDDDQNIPINEIFDILPLNGVLEPGMSETVEFVYYGVPDKKFTAKAICQVEGGPDEQVDLIGESSRISYKLSISETNNFIDFEDQIFSIWTQKEFVLSNLGKVPFDFKIRMDNIIRKGLIKITPSQGKIAGGSKTKIVIHFCPGLPGDYLEMFKIQVAHFEAETITLRGYGLYPALKFELPRVKTDELQKRIEEDGISYHNLSLDGTKLPEGTQPVYPSDQIVSDVDRKILFEAIMKNIENRQALSGSVDSSVGEFEPAATQGENFNMGDTAKNNTGFRKTNQPKVEKQLIDKIIVGIYTLDLGNVIAGNNAEGLIRLYNVGKMRSSIFFDQRLLRIKGLRLSQERLTLNNKDQNWQDIKVFYQTKKNTEPKHYVFTLPVEIQNGAKYQITIKANVTVPSIGLSMTDINFGDVICGQKKIVTVRFSNNKEVPCHWKLAANKQAKKLRGKGQSSSEGKFIMSPVQGSLVPYSECQIEIAFTPTGSKSYLFNFYIEMDDNQESIEVVCKGQGVIPELEFLPENMSIAPSLPYDENVYRTVQIKNKSNFATELFSLNFDAQYKKEDLMLKVYKPLQEKETLFLDVKEAGQPFWSNISEYFKVYQFNDEIESKIKVIREKPDLTDNQKEEQISELEKSKKDFPEEIKYPTRIEDSRKRFVVVWGPEKSGKTALAKQLSRNHLRGVVNLNELFEWNQNHKSNAYFKAKDYLEAKEPERDAFIAEKEKEFKKKAKKGDKFEVNTDHFYWLPDEVLLELLKERLKDIDCNTGAIFDNIYSKYFENELVALKAIFEACKNSEVQIVNLEIPTDQSGMMVCNPIDYEVPVNLDSQEKKRKKAKDVNKDKNNESKLSNRVKSGKVTRNKPQGLVQKPMPSQPQAPVSKTQRKQEAGKPLDAKKDPAKILSKSRLNTSNDSQISGIDSEGHVDDTGSHTQEKGTEKFTGNWFEVNELAFYTPEQIQAHTVKTKEILDYFLNKIPDEKIHKYSYAIAQELREAEEKKNAKKAPAQAAKDKNAKDKNVKKDPKQVDSKKLSRKESQVIEDIKPVEPVAEELLEFPQNRFFSHIPIIFNTKQMISKAMVIVPDVNYPDPLSLPDPVPYSKQIVRKQYNRKALDEVNVKHLQILTPRLYMKQAYISSMLEAEFATIKLQTQEKLAKLRKEEENEIERLRLVAEELKQKADLERKRREEAILNGTEEASKNAENPKTVEEQDHMTSDELKKIQLAITELEENLEKELLKRKEELEAAPEIQIVKEHLDGSQSRWIIPPGETIYLVLKFFSKQIQTEFNCTIDFENTYSFNKPLAYNVQTKCDFPKINTNPLNVFANRKRKRPTKEPESLLSLVYVMSESIFDFGPLLMGKKADNKHDPAMLKVNSTVFRMTNDGNYKAEVNFDLASSVISTENYKKDIFVFEPHSLDLEIGETKEVRVWCIPDQAKVFQDELICMVKGNPKPFVIPMKCLGASPKLKLSDSLVEYDRLLLNKECVKQISLLNNNSIPAKWSIQGVDSLGSIFTISQTEGIIKPSGSTVIDIAFKSDTQQVYEKNLILKVEDVEEIGIKQEDQPLKLKSESYNINVEFQGFQNNQQIIEFGDVEVGRKIERSFFIENKGLYQIRYNFVTKKKIFRDNFKIIPEKGVIYAQEKQEIKVMFETNYEMRMRSNAARPDVVLEIIEGNTHAVSPNDPKKAQGKPKPGAKDKKKDEAAVEQPTEEDFFAKGPAEIFNQVSVNVNVNAVYSNYALNPSKTINFGPLQFGEQKTRTFEIRNDGLFDFTYNLFDYNNEERRQELAEIQKKVIEEMKGIESGDPKDKKKKKDDKPATVAAAAGKKPAPGKKGANPLALEIGQFTISPMTGTIPPNSSAQIEVNFSAVGSQICENKIAVDILNRNPEDQPKGIIYELFGESCIPAINTTNFDAIFEEQIAVQNLNTTGRNIQEVVNSNVFSIEDKTFFFGNLVPSKYPDGVKEKFKIINNGKVHANVKFEISKSETNPNDLFAFEVFPAQAKIAPHESVYVKVTFKPTIMASYSGLFQAYVENGDANSKKNGLKFELKGSGVLPTLKLAKPTEWENENTPLLKFPKLRKGKRAIENIVIQNDGVIPGTVKFDLLASPNFKFLSQTSYTISAKSFQSFQVEFNPSDIGKFDYAVQFSTLLNPYEDTTLLAKGECYFDEIGFEGLPDNADDEVSFGDNTLNTPKRITFFMKNFSDEPKQFEWDLKLLQGLQIKPQKGHINAKGTKAIHLTFNSDTTVQHKKAIISCKTRGIIQSSQTFQDWDDSRKRRKMVSATEYNWMQACIEAEKAIEDQERALLSKGKKVPKRKDNYLPAKPAIPEHEKKDIEIQEVIPEPAYDYLKSPEKHFSMSVSGNTDSTKYECDTKSINFKPTMMYTSRVHSFKLKNNSLISMPYRWVFYNKNQDEDSGYYTIHKEKGVISAQSEEVFEIKFSPMEVDESNMRLLRCLMPNLDENEQPLEIKIDANTERPVCHFELPLSNYLQTRNGDVPNIDNSNLKVIEFESLGIKVRNKNRFYVVNPTAIGYEFVWKRLDLEVKNGTVAGGQSSQDLSSFFVCATDRGIILSGKKYEMIFEYQPEIQGTHEGLWVFEIPKMNVVKYFLTVGKVMEPKVFFEVGKVDFGPLLLSGQNKETVKLKNLDHLPYHFNFSKSSIRGESEYGDSLQVTPLKGVINGDSEVAINISFKPKIEGAYNYNLVCNVAQKPGPVTLNVKGVGYMLHHSVHLDDVHAPVLTPNDIHAIDFGNNFVNEKRSKIIVIKNDGDFNFDFIIKKTNFNFVTITPETATVKTGSKVEIEVTYQPIKEYKLKSLLHQLTLSIISGPNYFFRLSGESRRPGVDLSFSSYDFGPCFMLKTPVPKTVMLRMYNRDNAAMTIEPVFEKKKFLDVVLPSGQVLLPKDDSKPMNESGFIDIPIIFTPREIKKYEEIVRFDINQLHAVDVKITGEGVPLKLDLARAEDSFVDFGICRVGSDQTKVVTLLNSSKKQVTITFDVENQLVDLRKLAIGVFPEGEIVINSREKLDIELRFNPQVRINSFKKDFMYSIVENGEVHKLNTIQGSCHGLELKLMDDSLNFGGVVVGSKLIKKLQMNNMGDIGAKFEWDTAFCGRYFSITPNKGFLPANDSIKFDVAFHPDVVEDISFNIRCVVDNSIPLALQLSGRGVQQKVEEAQEIKFETVVRTKVKSKVSIKNPTAINWRIKGNISSIYDRFQGYFIGAESLEVKPNSSADYEIEYLPLSMTKNDKTPEISDAAHEAKLFFPLPDGSALMYNLTGKSLPPKAVDAINIQIKAKKEQVTTIPIQNWLGEKQRFEVTWTIEEDVNKSIVIRGANTIDIPGNLVKQYKLNILGIKQGASKFTLKFRNPVSGEYVFYNISTTVLPPDSLEAIKISSVVREVATHVISIDNPLDTAVEFKPEQISCDDPNISVNPNHFTIPPKSEFGLELSYRPLIEGTKQATLKLGNQILGEYVYTLHLTGTQNLAHKSMYFKASLGSDIVQTFKFMNYVKKPTAYTVRIEPLGGTANVAAGGKGAKQVAGDFSVANQTINAPASDRKEGVEVQVNVRFEPSSQNESRAVMYITSPEGGNYQSYLIGTAMNPQPKGPFKSGGKGAAIEFKNPFMEATEFILRIDNPNFQTTAKSPLKIEGKKSVNISIAFKANKDFSNNGRLTLSTANNITWTFYLQGE